MEDRGRLSPSPICSLESEARSFIRSSMQKALLRSRLPKPGFYPSCLIPNLRLEAEIRTGWVRFKFRDGSPAALSGDSLWLVVFCMTVGKSVKRTTGIAFAARFGSLIVLRVGRKVVEEVRSVVTGRKVADTNASARIRSNRRPSNNRKG